MADERDEDVADVVEELESEKQADESESLEGTTDDSEESEESEDEESEESEDEESEESKDETSEGEESSKKGGFKRRIDKLSAENEALKAKLAVYEVPTEVGAKPSLDDFEDYGDYIEALTDWKVANAQAEREKKAQQDHAKKKFEATVANFQQKSKVFADQHADYTDVLRSVDDIVIPPAVQQALLVVEDGPALMYELAKNRQVLEDIVNSDPIVAVLKMAELSKPGPKTTKPKVTSAPEPVKPVRTSSNKPVGSYDDGMSLEEFRAWRSRQ